MPPAALIIGGIAAVGSTVAGAIGAGQRMSAAEAQQARARELYGKAEGIYMQTGLQVGRGNDAAARGEAASKMTPQELMTLETTVRNDERTIQRESQLLDAVDPAIMEAGKQAYAMLQGQEATTLGPLKQQRARDRQKLTETLRRQLGPGFETSSAGIEALSRFDEGTSSVLGQAQQNAIGQFLGVSQNAAGMSRSSINAANQGIRATGAQFGQIAARSAQGSFNAAQTFNQGARELNLAGQTVQSAGQAELGAGRDVVGASGGVASAIGGGFNQLAGFAGMAQGNNILNGSPAAGASSGGGGIPTNQDWANYTGAPSKSLSANGDWRNL